MTPEEGPKAIDDWLNNLPTELEKTYSFLSDSVKKFQTFDLLSYFSYYNHLHDAEKYSDFRGDKNFFASEVIALLCLKNEFICKSEVSEDNYMELIIEMQKSVLSYCGWSDMVEFKKNRKIENPISEISSLLAREAKQVRNPGLPDHHLIFTEKLFEPIKNEIKSLFGFSISDSVIIRKYLPDLINKKCKSALDIALEKGNSYAKEIIKYRKTKTVEAGSEFTKEQLEEYSKLADKKIKQGLQNHLLNELYYTFSNLYLYCRGINRIHEYRNIFSQSFFEKILLRVSFSKRNR